jgi:hypothetical protein
MHKPTGYLFGVFMFAVNATSAFAAEVPAVFHGAGCNLQYSYSRTPKGDAMDCRAARSEGEPATDEFIRINNEGVGGWEWQCTVKHIKTSNNEEFSFEGECGDSGSTWTANVALIMRPGKVVIVDIDTKGQHDINIYHLLDGLR